MKDSYIDKIFLSREEIKENAKKDKFFLEYIRDFSIGKEKDDLGLALKLMSIAKEVRPNGPLINSKVRLYQKKIYKDKRWPVLLKFLSNVESFEFGEESQPFKIKDINNETQKIIRAIRNNKIDLVNEKLIEIAKSDRVVFEHPIKTGLMTYCLSSYSYGMSNFLLMIDSELLHPWICVQSGCLIDCAIVNQDRVYFTLGGGSIEPALANLRMSMRGKPLYELFRIEERNAISIKGFGGFSLSSNRPSHFIYDQLPSLNTLFENKIIESVAIDPNNTFYNPIGFRNCLRVNEIKTNKYYIFPMSISFARLKSSKNNMDNFVSKLDEEIFRSCVSIFDKDTVCSRFRLWLGISNEKRGWLEMKEGYVNIIKEMYKYLGAMTIVFDGITSTLYKKVNNNEGDIIDYIKHELSIYDIEFISLSNFQFSDKVKYCNQCDLAITSGGTAAIIPTRITCIDSILHTTKAMNTTPSRNIGQMTLITDDEKLSYDKEVSAHYRSYSLDWRYLLDLVFEILKSRE